MISLSSYDSASLLPVGYNEADSEQRDEVRKLRLQRNGLVAVAGIVSTLAFVFLILFIHSHHNSNSSLSSSPVINSDATSSLLSQSTQPTSSAESTESAECQHPSVHGRHGVVSTTHYLATEAGLNVLKQGGNAFDAAATIQFVLNVVQPQSTGIGGGCFVVGYNASQDHVFTLDGREEQPFNFNSTSFCLNPQCVEQGDECDCDSGVWPFEDRVTGGHPVGVPGVVAAMHRLLGDHGSISMAEALQPAIKLARDGFPMYGDMMVRLLNNSARMTQFESTKKTYFPNNGQPVGIGEIFKNPDLAATFELLAAKGWRAFYEGDLSKDIVSAVRTQVNQVTKLKGVMSLDDLSNYRAVYRQPLKSHYRSHIIYGMPMPSSGGLSIAQMLNELESFQINFKATHGEFLHRLIDVQDMTFADRNLYMGDGDWIDVPVKGLLDKQYAAVRVAQLSRVTTSARAEANGIIGFGIPDQSLNDPFQHVTPANHADDDHGTRQVAAGVNSQYITEAAEAHSIPTEHQRRHARHLNSLHTDTDQHSKHSLFHERYATGEISDKRGTTHLVVVDKWGNVVSMTTTIEENFGSGVVVPNRGFLLNNELTDFQALPYDPESRKPFANGSQRGWRKRRTALGQDVQTMGGKRPMSSMSPTIVFKARTVGGDAAKSVYKPWLALGSPGGSMIIGTVVNGLVNVLDFNMCISDAVDAPRVISQNTNVTLMESPLLTEQKYRADIELLSRRQFVIGEVHTKRPLNYIEAAILHSDNDYETVADSKRLPQAKADAY